MYSLGQIERTVQVDIEEILDELDTETIEDYLEERHKDERKPFDEVDAKATLIDLCVGRCRRNMEGDKEEVKSTILKLIDEVFI